LLVATLDALKQVIDVGGVCGHDRVPILDICEPLLFDHSIAGISRSSRISAGGSRAKRSFQNPHIDGSEGRVVEQE
jgi:hypothetical protein